MTVLKSFPPVVDARSRALILGSMPGPEALRKRQYYGFEGNHFWRILSELLGRSRPARYAHRLRLLRSRRIALWDTLASCRRLSALDSHIRRPEPNDVPGLLARFPGIRAVFLNGRAAHGYYKRFFAARVALPAFYLPSTSPANAGISFRGKKRRWARLLRFL